MNWQKFIGIIAASLAGSAIYEMTNYNWKAIVCCAIVGLGGVIYGDAD